MKTVRANECRCKCNIAHIIQWDIDGVKFINGNIVFVFVFASPRAQQKATENVPFYYLFFSLTNCRPSPTIYSEFRADAADV